MKLRGVSLFALYPRFREIGTVSGWEKLQIHAKEDISGREKERKREQDTASLRSDFDSISDTRYLRDVYFSRCETGGGGEGLEQLFERIHKEVVGCFAKYL